MGEVVMSGLFAAAGPLIMHPMHPLTMWIFMIILVSASVEDHSGYDFPFSLSNWSFGLYGGPKAHDRHHVAFYGNYAPFFSFWDKIFGTELSLKDDKREN
jgi:sterol desaturase/sphingolipid hydroxylase (fatty acid hydroxylase superfamily)